jgi:hypothetical protein
LPNHPHDARGALSYLRGNRGAYGYLQEQLECPTVDGQQALAVFREVLAETEPNKLIYLTLQQLEGYYNSLHETRPYLLGMVQDGCDARMHLLRREIELKRVEERSERQHEQTIRLGKKTLFWAVVAALGSVGLLLLDIPFPRFSAPKHPTH